MQKKDHYGKPLNVGDRVSGFRAAGDFYGWDPAKGDMGTVSRLDGGPVPGVVLVVLDGSTGYEPPHDKRREWFHPYTLIKIEEGE